VTVTFAVSKGELPGTAVLTGTDSEIHVDAEEIFALSSSLELGKIKKSLTFYLQKPYL
jgi:hypothetical protein